MGIGLTDESNYKAIAKSIRAKNGSTDTYTPGEMAAAILAIESGIELDTLENPATSQKIFYGYEAYNSDGEVIVGKALPRLSNPATSQQILSGYEAYDVNGNKLSGTAFLTGGYVEFTLEASKWNGTTYTVTTNEWMAVDGQTPLMDLPYTSSSVNASRVVESGITMPSVSSETDSNSGVTTTTLVFSALTTPPVDVIVSVFNITEIVSTVSEGGSLEEVSA